MEEEMEELYVEGVATHGGPESCVVVCEGGGEALTGARAGRAIEPRNVHSGVPTLSQRRKATSAAAISRGAVGPPLCPPTSRPVPASQILTWRALPAATSSRPLRVVAQATASICMVSPASSGPTGSPVAMLRTCTVESVATTSTS